MTAIASKRPRRISVVISAIVMILGCCITPVILIGLPIINPPSPYPNSARSSVCEASNYPFIEYVYYRGSIIPKIIIRVQNNSCFSSSYPIDIVADWYIQQGFSIAFFRSTSVAIVKNKGFANNLVHFLLLHQVNVVSINNHTEIEIIGGYAIEVGGP